MNFNFIPGTEYIQAYGVAILISIIVASSELIAKFKDEPFKTLIRHKSSWSYLAFNALIAFLCLYLLTKTNIFGKEEVDLIKAALTAGFGSTILMRSKFFKVSVDGKEVAVGPEMIINVYLEALENIIDRERALVRKNLVEHCMTQIDFQKARGYVETTVISSRQNASPQVIEKLMDTIKDISTSHEKGEKEKSLALGYLILDIMGEKFFRELFNDNNKKEFLRKEQERSG